MPMVRIVLEQPFFSGLGPEFGSAISGRARLRFADGAYLFREGEPANEFYQIRQGTVALELHSPGQQPVVVALNRVPVMMRLRLQTLVPVPVSCSWNRRISSAVAVSGERFKYAANRLQLPMASLCARVELARAHVLDHALAQRADGIGTHRELS
jgi:hypothetical protein